MIRQWIEFSRRPEVRSRVVFLSDYDVLMAEQLVQGVDVWVNTPRRPWEASGTSGMKVLVNGGLNLSELDGWWAEAYSPEVGWAIGDGREHGDDPAWDAAEAEALYGLLEREVVPEFYTRDEHGIPRGWVARMRESMARLTPAFSTNRAVRQYTEEHYLSAAAAFRQRAAKRGSLGADLLNWQAQLAKHWPSLRFGSATVEQKGGQYLFQVQVFLDDLDPDAVRVELYAEGRKTAPRRANAESWRASGWVRQRFHVHAPCPERLAPPRTTLRASFPSIREHWCRLEAPLFCGTTRPRGDELAGAVPLQNSRNHPMPDQLKLPDQQQPVELTTDFLGEDRHEFVAKLAYQLWEERGRPLGSPEVDWFAAEQAVYSALVASNLVAPFAIDPQPMAEKLYE